MGRESSIPIGLPAGDAGAEQDYGAAWDAQSR